MNFTKEKSLKVFFLMLAAIIGTFFLNMSLVQAESSGDVPVTYTIENPVTYPFTVKVRGAGEAKFEGGQGNEVIRNSEKQYLLEIGTPVTVSLKADEGSKLISATLNAKDITAEVKNNRITLESDMKEETLIITFEESNKGNPNTGDNIRTGFCLVIGVIAIALCAGPLYKWKRRGNDGDGKGEC